MRVSDDRSLMCMLIAASSTLIRPVQTIQMSVGYRSVACDTVDTDVCGDMEVSERVDALREENDRLKEEMARMKFELNAALDSHRRVWEEYRCSLT